ncbi:MAG: internalization-related competence protein ComEC/Rec2 protein [Parcubacteria group bacterium GW2011_GWA1_47_8]|nr:MAG: internalization-related competence protein ComEC/Rec2 protein [Parcubacteria group bacterium GW2011_GWA1_47_8]KKW07642.1 MAG: internalization-related competence protein ComEC/Rec2 protein [Parcubacteria group bacterium GW2011_GWA2_49_16]
MYVYGSTLGFVCGAALETFLGFGFSFAILFACLAVLVAFFTDLGLWHVRGFLVSSVLFACGLGILSANVSSVIKNVHVLDAFAGKSVVAHGVVARDPDVRDQYTNIILEVNSFLQEQSDLLRTLPSSVRILVRVPPYPELRYGDEVTVEGKISIPKNFPADPGGRAFDYRAYLAKDGVHYEISYPRVSVVAHGKGNRVYETLFAGRDAFLAVITKIIPEPEASLAGGILLGAQQSLGTELLQKFRETGVAHIVVLSGYNIAIVATAISRLLSVLPLAWRLIGSALGIVLFAMMVGGGSTVVRATVMALIIILGRALGRTGDALRALCFAGVVMVALNPLILLSDVSFQLSFAATFAILAFAPVIEKYFLWVSPRFGMREIFVATVSAQIFVLPILLYHMGTMSLVGMIANFFVLPFIPLAMLMVFATSIVGMGSAFAAMPLVAISYVLLWYIISVVEFFAALPFASVEVSEFPLVAVFVSYIFFGVLIVKHARSSKQKNASSLRAKKSTYEF